MMTTKEFFKNMDMYKDLSLATGATYHLVSEDGTKNSVQCHRVDDEYCLMVFKRNDD